MSEIDKLEQAMGGNDFAVLTQSAFNEGFKERELYILEKVKEKIFNKQDEFVHSGLLSDCNVRYGLEIAEIIIDKEMAELIGKTKGE